VELDWWRREKYLARTYSARSKLVLGVDDKSLTARKKKAEKVIRTLEKHMKRANSRLIAEVGRDAYDAFTSAWRSHIRWIRLWRTYFKPMPIGPSPSKRLYQAIINDLERIAKAAIVEEGFELPSPAELRRAIRLFAVSSRRGRQGNFGIQALLRGIDYAKWNLFEFIEKRLKLKPSRKK
jgi:hypothetical protein